MSNYENEYNLRLRKYNERLNKMYKGLEKEGIVLLSDLRIEIESEVINRLEISDKEMFIEMKYYINKIFSEMLGE